MKLHEDLTLQFDQADVALWYKLIEKELKGKPYDETLLKQLSEGIITKPYYTKEDLTESAKAIHSFLLKAKPAAGWDSVVSISTSDFSEAKLQLKLSLEKGVECIVIEHPFALHQYQELLADVDGQFVRVYINFNGDSSSLKTALSTGGAYVDNIGNALLTGDFENISTSKSAGLTKIDARYLQWAGADVVQELAYTLAWSLETFLWEKDRSGHISPDKFLINFSASTSYFQEIAKLRAFRILWDMLLRQSDLEKVIENQLQPRIHVETARYQFGANDPQTNILRSATQAMAAVSGLADGVAVLAFDAATAKTNEFSHRIATNIHYMLKFEAHLDKVNDPLGGSYYVETLTQNLVDAAWSQFENIEAQGGFLAMCKSGEVQSTLRQQLQQRRQQIELGKTVYIGENKYGVERKDSLNMEAIYPSVAPHNLALSFEPLTKAQSH